MKYSVKCNSCGKTFVAETEKYGRFKYRCPYCGHVLTCQLSKPENLTVEASSVLPVSDDQLSLPYYASMPVVEARVIHASVEALKSAGRTVEKVGQQSKTTLTKVLDHIEVFFDGPVAASPVSARSMPMLTSGCSSALAFCSSLRSSWDCISLPVSQRYWRQAIAWRSSTGLSSVTS